VELLLRQRTLEVRWALELGPERHAAQADPMLARRTGHVHPVRRADPTDPMLAGRTSANDPVREASKRRGRRTV
jgi:hypothetical protein